MIAIDASFALAVLFDEQKFQATEILLFTGLRENLYAPIHLTMEIGNAFITNVKRKRITQNDFERLFLAFETLNIQYNIIKDQEDLLDIANFSQIHQLTFYDASYLWLAIKMKAKIATYDKQIIAVAAKLGVERLG